MTFNIVDYKFPCIARAQVRASVTLEYSSEICLCQTLLVYLYHEETYK